MATPIPRFSPIIPSDNNAFQIRRKPSTLSNLETVVSRAALENTPPRANRDSSVSPIKRERLQTSLFADEPAQVSNKKSNSVFNEVCASPPRAPTKSSKFNSRAGVAAPFNPFKDQHQKLLKGEFNSMKVVFFAEGSYCNVYSIEGADHLLLKAFHGVKSGFNESRLRNYLIHSAKNYAAIQALGLPVAEITNIGTMVEKGHIIQRKIPHALDMDNPAQMAKVQAFFTASSQNNVPMDLQAQNFRVDEKGTVYLIDFLEETINDTVEEEVDYHINSSLATFSPDIAKFLTANASNWQSRSQ
jgi:hypothetical protein